MQKKKKKKKRKLKKPKDWQGTITDIVYLGFN